jgi:hypothetical protein
MSKRGDEEPVVVSAMRLLFGCLPRNGKKQILHVVQDDAVLIRIRAPGLGTTGR